MSDKSRRKSNPKPADDHPAPSLSDLLEELLSILRPRVPARVPVRNKPIYPGRVKNRR